MGDLKVSDFYGAVTKHSCTNPQVPMNCPACFCRGYVAECLSCMGSGMVEEVVAGGSGKMKVVCNPCAGKGFFAVNRPVNFEAVTAAREAAVDPLMAAVEAVEKELAAAV